VSEITVKVHRGQVMRKMHASCLPDWRAWLIGCSCGPDCCSAHRASPAYRSSPPYRRSIRPYVQ
jgi:hypothetical protein